MNISAINFLVAVEMSDYGENSRQCTVDRDSSQQMSHTLESKPLPVGTDTYGNYVISWLLLFQNMYNSGSFLPDLKSPE